MLTSQRRDEGSLTLLVIGYAGILALLVVVGIDASKVFLARRALSSVADAAALAATQAVDRPAVYAGQAGCGQPLPLDPAAAERAAAATVDDHLPSLRGDFTAIDPPGTSVDANGAAVHLTGTVRLPLAGIVSILLPDRDGVTIDVTATAASPLVSPDGGC